MEQLTGKEVIRPDIAGLMGAFGAALLAHDRCQEKSTLVDATTLSAFDYRSKSYRCGGCGNNCLVTAHYFPAGVFHTGNRCPRGAGPVSYTHLIVDRILRERQPDDRIVLVVSAMGDHTDDLLTLAAKVNPEMPKRELDMLLATGEQVSIALMASAFCAKGQPAVSFTGAQAGIKTNDKHSKASILDVQACQVKQALDEGKIVIVAGFQGITDLGQILSLIHILNASP